jgi:pSer/pThr/pTyr-binding forkhead associated (FHA) protein
MAEKRPSLTVLGGPMAGTKFVLEEGIRDVFVGSDESCQFRITLEGVSPLHAHLVVDATGVSIQDAGSDKGLHVNDSPVVATVPLRNGDIVWLGTPGETDVVMLQCILPRVVTAPPPTLDAGPSEPIPIDEETLALGPDALDDVAGTAAHHGTPEPAAPDESVTPGPTRARTELTFVEDGETGSETVSYAEERPLAAASSPAFFEDETEETAIRAPAFEDPTATTVVMAPDDVAEVSTEPTFVMPETVEPPIPFAPEPAGYSEPAAEPTLAAPPAFEPSEEEAGLPPTIRAASAPAPAPEARPSISPSKTTTPRPNLATPRPSAPTPAPVASPAPGSSSATPVARRPAPSPRPAPRPVAPRPAPASARRASSTPVGLYAAIAVVVLVAVGGGAYYMMSRRSSPAPPPTQVAQSPTPVPPTLAAMPLSPPVEEPPPPTTPEAVATGAATPAPPTPAPPTTLAAVPPTTLRPVASPSPTPSPKVTPTPAAKATASPTTKAPPATTPAPSAEAVRAQQTAAQVAGLLGQADSALAARQYDAAIGYMDEVLKLDPANAKAAADRASAVSLRDAARKKFVPGRTVVKTEKAQDRLAGFDGAAVQKAPDFLGRIEFDMSPSSGLKAGDPYSLKFFLVNEGKKAVRVGSLSATTTVNGSGTGSSVPAKVKEVDPQQRALVGELPGVWKDGTSSWAAELLLTANKGDSLKNSLTWR